MPINKILPSHYSSKKPNVTKTKLMSFSPNEDEEGTSSRSGKVARRRTALHIHTTGDIEPSRVTRRNTVRTIESGPEQHAWAGGAAGFVAAGLLYPAETVSMRYKVGGQSVLRNLVSGGRNNVINNRYKLTTTIFFLCVCKIDFHGRSISVMVRSRCRFNWNNALKCNIFRLL